MDFNIRVFTIIDVFGQPLWLTESIVNTWIIMAVLITFAVVARIMLRTYTTGAPTGIQNVVETIVEAFDKFARGAAGDKLYFLGGWFFAVFMFALFSNLSGLIPLFRPPTADWSVAFALAMATFLIIQVMAFKYRGAEYFLTMLLKPIPIIFFPMNLIGELARPISLSFRLFGNILAGTILLGLFYGLTPAFVHYVIPAALHLYFDLAMGALQAFIFTVLSLSFIGTTAGTSE